LTAEQGHSGLGLEAQQAAVRAFCAGQGWVLVAEPSDVASGKDERRAGFQAALTAAKARGRALGGDRGYRPAAGLDAAAAAQAKQEAAGRAAHRLSLELERLRAEGAVAHAAIARALTERGILTPQGSSAWTHTTVARGSCPIAWCRSDDPWGVGPPRQAGTA
jgi:hypothetical protein